MKYVEITALSLAVISIVVLMFCGIASPSSKLSSGDRLVSVAINTGIGVISGLVFIGARKN